MSVNEAGEGRAALDVAAARCVGCGTTQALGAPCPVCRRDAVGLERLGLGVVEVVRPGDLEVHLRVHVDRAGPEVGQLVRRVAPGGAFDVFLRPHDRGRPCNRAALAAYLREGLERGFLTEEQARQVEKGGEG